MTPVPTNDIASPNAVTLTGGQQACAGFLIGNAAISRAGGTSASASSGQGGWQVTDRTRRKAATEWLDYYPFVMTMKLRFDDAVVYQLQAGQLIQGQSSVPDCEISMMILESFEVPQPGSSPPLPPLITIDGPVPHTDLTWVCSRLSQEGDDGSGVPNQFRNSEGLRTMQVVTIELTEYSPSAAIVAPQTPAQVAALNLGAFAGNTVIAPSGKTYTVKAGDSLITIASTQLGNSALWQQLALLNGLSNSALLQPGQVLQLPAVS